VGTGVLLRALRTKLTKLIRVLIEAHISLWTCKPTLAIYGAVQQLNCFQMPLPKMHYIPDKGVGKCTVCKVAIRSMLARDPISMYIQTQVSKFAVWEVSKIKKGNQYTVSPFCQLNTCRASLGENMNRHHLYHKLAKRCISLASSLVYPPHHLQFAVALLWVKLAPDGGCPIHLAKLSGTISQITAT